MDLAFIPSPSEGVWHLGPLPLRAYALAIIAGIVVSIWVGERRFVARGGRPGTVSDVAVWAIPFGLVGARAYHVATNPEFYFGNGKDPIQALYVWEGGLGIWGAIGFGALGAYIGCRFSGVKFTSFIDAVAPGIVLAQAIGRWGNYFNQELFGKPTDLPWGLEISLDNRPEGYLEYSTFQPTFLYESLWCIGVAIVIVLADRRYQLGRGRVFALYVALYTAGRAWIEYLRIDDAHHFFGVRLNVWVAGIIFVLAVAYFIIVGRRRPGREESVYREGREPPVAEDEQAKADEKDRVEAKVGAGAAAAEGAGASSGDASSGGDTVKSEPVSDETAKVEPVKAESKPDQPADKPASDQAKADETAEPAKSDETEKPEPVKAESKPDEHAEKSEGGDKAEAAEPTSEEAGKAEPATDKPADGEPKTP